MSGIEPRHLLEAVIRPTLRRLGAVNPALESEEAAWLLLGTAAVESHMGRYLRQVGGGPALSPWQVEPVTARDLLGRYLARRRPLREAVYALTAARPDTVEDFLAGDLYLACALARLRYWTSPNRLPGVSDAEAQAAYWIRWYNRGGKGTTGAYLAAWAEHVRPLAGRTADVRTV